MLRDKINHAARWAVINSIWAAVVWIGVVEGVPGFYNLVIFLVPIVAFMTLGYWSVQYKEEVVKEPAKFRLIQYTLEPVFDWVILGIFIYFGHFVLGFLYLVHMINIAQGRKVKDEINSQTEG